MDNKRNSDKNILPGLIFGLIFMTFIVLCIVIHPKDVGSKESFQKLNNLKNSITGDFLSECKIQTTGCEFNNEEVDFNELAEYIGNSNSQSAYAPGHSIPLARITFAGNKKDNEYLMIYISIYENNRKGTALLACELYRNDTGLALDYFSSAELTEWAKRYLRLLPL